MKQECRAYIERTATGVAMRSQFKIIAEDGVTEVVSSNYYKNPLTNSLLVETLYLVKTRVT
jgi:type II secretory pathway component HofQ